ncbi:MAG: hypothetical protein LBE92_16570 [Chryseobacterium sp.]|uniref:hypothetical protein n=1 Tax=Chryseobacterium sp. TaxID=1871047 RepID=UPI00281FD7F6|nr:hypothetical protein [Chryseobacterium sp.]MDR2237738.1 hypothetical protein [Chryseobacterium sp.]
MILPILFIVFGIFLRRTSWVSLIDPKKLSNVFIILGISSLVKGIFLYYVKVE